MFAALKKWLFGETEKKEVLPIMDRQKREAFLASHREISFSYYYSPRCNRGWRSSGWAMYVDGELFMKCLDREYYAGSAKGTCMAEWIKQNFEEEIKQVDCCRLGLRFYDRVKRKFPINWYEGCEIHLDGSGGMDVLWGIMKLIGFEYKILESSGDNIVYRLELPDN